MSESRDIFLVFVAMAIQGTGRHPTMRSIQAATRVLELGNTGPILDPVTHKVKGYTWTLLKEELGGDK